MTRDELSRETELGRLEFEKRCYEEDLKLRRDEFEHKKTLAEQRRNQRQEDAAHAPDARHNWRDPLTLAIIAAFVGLTGNALVALINNRSQAAIEDRRAEAGRVLEAIKAKPDQAIRNLDFLVKVGLVSDKSVKEKLKAYLASDDVLSGPSLGYGIAEQAARRFQDPLPADIRKAFPSEYARA
jgi:hypothetical protein